MNRSTSIFRLARQRGVALVLVLVFVVLVTGLVVAYFSRATLERQVSNGSAATARADLLASSAAEVITADLIQEIVAGSASPAPAYADGTSLYMPVTTGPNPGATMVPLVSGAPAPAADGVLPIPNLVKRSARSSDPTYAAPPSYYSNFPPNRASAVNSVTDASLNGRSVDRARWNSHYLIPRDLTNVDGRNGPKSNQSATIGTNPVPSFTGPDWVIMTRANQAGLNAGGTVISNADLANLRDPTSDSFAIGRYAYTIYNEGGLLDMNVAGYPYLSPGLSPTQAGNKASLAFADARVIPTAGGTLSTGSSLNSLINWRNYATLQQGTSYSGYINYGFNAPNGFLSVNSTPYVNSNGKTLTDQAFATRQRLLQYWRFLPGNAPQDSLQYMATFTRDLDQPSFAPDSGRPPLQVASNGGNSVTPADYDKTNPSFLSARVKSPIKARASDGSSATIGEALVKHRFPLNRIAWLTYNGPSASRTIPTTKPTSVDDPDYDMWALVNVHGISKSFLEQGTPANIAANFGFTSFDYTNRRWNYRNSPSSPGPILKLEDVALLPGLNAREPDFFELLKSAVSAGTLAKAATKANPTGIPEHPYDIQYNQDFDFDRAIMQLGANIIDQFDVDGFSTGILFANGSVSSPNSQVVRGVENHPYVYRMRVGTLKLREANPITGVAPNTADPWLNTAPTNLKDAGVCLMIQVPEIWNPHDQNVSLGSPRPSKFQLTVDSTDPRSIPDPANPYKPRVPTAGDLVDYHTIGASGHDTIAAGNPTSDAVHTNPSDGNPAGSGYVPFSTRPNGAGADMGYSGFSRSIWSGATSDTAAVSTIFTFQIPTPPSPAVSTLFREPTLLVRPGLPKFSDPWNDSQLLGPNYGLDSTYLGDILNTAGQPSFQNGGFLAEAENPLALSTPPAKASARYTGVVLGAFPAQWLGQITTAVKNGRVFRADQGTLVSSTRAATNPPGNSPPVRYLTYRLQYQDSGSWVTYDTKYTEANDLFVLNACFNPNPSPANPNGFTTFGGLMQKPDFTNFVSQPPGATASANINWQSWSDPRTSRFGAMTSSHTTSMSTYYPPGATGTASDWVDEANSVLVSNRPTKSAGSALPSKGRDFLPIYPYNFYGLYRDTAGFFMDGTSFRNGIFAQNIYGSQQYYADPDGVVRRAMGGYTTGVPAVANVGLPSLKLSTGADQIQSRPFILNRPFRSVGELGNVFSDTPWKNINFFTAESGYTALLDVFCITDTSTAGAVIAGKVSLNTRQAPVLKAILAGAYKDEENTFFPLPTAVTTLSPLTPTEAQSLAADAANGLLQRTDYTNTTIGKGPLMNVAHLVGRWKSGTSTTVTPIDGSTAYDGFSNDLTALFGANTPSANIQRFRESGIRALASMGTTRVWNLMIDVIAQTGRYPQSVSNLDKFVVEGEQRYWVHVAIDRYTGQIIDKTTEVVKE